MRRCSANYRSALVIALVALSVLVILLACLDRRTPDNAANSGPSEDPDMVIIELPEPRHDGDMSVEQSLYQRRSIRTYASKPLTLQEVAQLLWAAQGITDPRGLRTAPSAGATYPLELYVAVGNVDDLSPGVYRYEPDQHRLIRTTQGDRRTQLAHAALGQSFVGEGAAVFVFTAVYERTTTRYGDRGLRYVYMEAGHAAQNLYLQAAAMNLGTVVVGAFHDGQVAEILDLPGNEQPLYIMPVGHIG
ncbi:MAG: SagB/ThcOx family dehydrogenase [Dehalococcoidia bacterium]